MNARLANPAKRPEYQQTTRASYILILAALASYVIVGLLSAYFHDWKTVWTGCGGAIFLSLPFVLLKRGHFRIGNVVLMLIVLVTVTIVATVGHGIHDISIVSYPIVLVYVGLTLDRVMLGIYGGLTFVAVLWLVFGAYFGWFVPVPISPKPLDLFSLISMTVLLIVAALAVDLLSSSMRGSLVVNARGRRLPLLFSLVPVLIGVCVVIWRREKS